MGVGNILKGIVIILGCLAVGEGVVFLLDVVFPGSLVGMLILTVALKRKWVSIDNVQGVAGLLIQYMALFFIVPAVGIIGYWDTIKSEWGAIVAAALLSTLIVMAVTALLFKKLQR